MSEVAIAPGEMEMSTIARITSVRLLLTAGILPKK